MIHDQPTNKQHKPRPQVTDPPGFWKEPPADNSWGIGFWCKTDDKQTDTKAPGEFTPVINPQTGKPIRVDEWDFE